jgi:hypothetical protein
MELVVWLEEALSPKNQVVAPALAVAPFRQQLEREWGLARRPAPVSKLAQELQLAQPALVVEVVVLRACQRAAGWA